MKMDTVGSRLRAARLKKGLTMKEVALQAGVPPSTYKEWEYGRAIQGEPYQSLANVLGLPLTELLNGTKDDPKTAADRFKKAMKLLRDVERDLQSLFGSD